ncbi:MAG: class I SAM-dependent methyltransferase [Alphaproteobacteria bacterium]|nr:MAG: class I SAM-dependent methyltransferase [Alphaproteobacteria bacterium]
MAEAVTDCAAGRDITVVDVGCGTTTIAPYFNRLARFVGVDIDPDVVRVLKEQGVEICETRDMPALKLEGEGMNAVVALYMLQFKIDDHFFNDVAKLMKDDDLMFANLYRIPDERKQDLKTQAEKAGLCIEEVPDTLLSPGRQVFWAVSKKPDAAAQLARRVEKGLGGLHKTP